MSAAPDNSDRIVAALKSEGTLDDLRKARLEKQFLAAAMGEVRPSLTSVPVPPARKTPRRGAWAAAAGALALAAAVLLWMRAGTDETPRYAVSSSHVGSASGAASSGTASNGTAQAGTELALAAGERAEVELFDLAVSVGERSRFRVDAVSLSDVRVSLVSGEARFAFHPRDRGHQHVAISTPAARVEIVGTELTVRATDTGTDVTVHEGIVRVIPTAGGEALLVEAGHSVTVAAPELAAAEPEAPSAELGPGPGDVGAGALAGEVVGELAPGAETTAPSDAETVETEIVAAPTAAELLARGDALLDRHAYAEAERVLRPVATDGSAARDDRASAWRTIGESRAARHDVAGALEAYEREVDLSRGVDRANAIYERAQLLERAGDLARARAELTRYLEEHPDGPNAARVRARLEALGAE